MTRITLLAAGAAAAALLGACHKSGSNAGRDVSNPGQSAPVNAVQDAASGPVGMASAAINGGDTAGFVTNASVGNLYELEAARIAVKRGRSPQVRAFARMMLNDHAKMGAEMKKALSDGHVDAPAPAALDQRRQGLVDNLNAAGDSDFDLAYLHQQLAAHMETLTLMQGYADKGDNASLKAMAAAAVPVVQHHLDEVKRIGGDSLRADLRG